MQTDKYWRSLLIGWRAPSPTVHTGSPNEAPSRDLQVPNSGEWYPRCPGLCAGWPADPQPSITALSALGSWNVTRNLVHSALHRAFCQRQRGSGMPDSLVASFRMSRTFPLRQPCINHLASQKPKLKSSSLDQSSYENNLHLMTWYPNKEEFMQNINILQFSAIFYVNKPFDGEALSRADLINPSN